MIAPMTRNPYFVLLTKGRTGSSALVSDIDKHCSIVCHQELFTRGQPPTPGNVETFNQFRGSQPHANLSDYLSYLSQDAISSKGRLALVGFKLLTNQLDEQRSCGLWEFLSAASLPIILLRRNPFDAGLSAAIARSRQVFNLRRGHGAEQISSICKANVDIDYLRSEIPMYEQWNLEWPVILEGAGCHFKVIEYDDYNANRLDIVNGIYSFLGKDQVSSMGINDYVKVTSGNPYEDIINARDVVSCLQELRSPSRARISVRSKLGAFGRKLNNLWKH